MLIPIGKLVDAYGLSGPDMEALAKAFPCQAPDSIMNRFYGARNQREDTIVDRNLDASMGLKAVEYIVVFFRTWAQERAEKDYQRNPFPFGGLHAFYREFINPKSVEYLAKDLSIFHQLANEACGRSPLGGWGEIAQNLNVKSGQDAGLALAYLAGELKKAALECCLIDKTEAMTFLVSNDYVFQKEVNGCSRAAHEAIVKKIAVDNTEGNQSAASVPASKPGQESTPDEDALIETDSKQSYGCSEDASFDSNELEPYADMVSDLPTFESNAQVSKGANDKDTIRLTRENNQVAHEHVKRLQARRVDDAEIIAYLKRHKCPASISQCLLFGRHATLNAAKTAYYACINSKKLTTSNGS